MKIFFQILLMTLIITSCKGDDKKSSEKKVFIVSKFNNDLEKHSQDTKYKNPDLSSVKEVKQFDYPKGAINFIILKDNSVYYYNEKLISNWCGWGSNKIQPMKRLLQKDSLHLISFNQIYPLLQSKSLDKNMRDYSDRLYHVSFSFDNDTIKNSNIYKLLHDIESLGYHSYNVRRIAQFEIEALK
ncbi:hypothetical protein [Chryseobacterium sp.]|uniref:hypothetical protein n=1 Tax=Chryseobacterium sp. TaxID=1871047 RepID=UPI0011D6AC2D|nr:hypothetical protein [Chryseobacterium sp.]TXF79539.1 hypothetical protein FUA25_03915 [Chryseobacterium sp.]